MKRTVAAAVLLVALVGCSSTKGSTSSSVSLQGRKWQATTITGKTVTTPAPYITFEKTTVTGNDGCNGIGGDYSVDGSTIKIGPLRGTLMACPDSDAAQEQAFATIMGGPTVTYDIRGETLNIHSPRGDIAFQAGTTAPSASG